jgi:polysaccharide biosynthesis protein PslG
MLVHGTRLRRAVVLALASAVLGLSIVVATTQPAHAAKKAVLPVTPNSFVGVVSEDTFASLGSGNGSAYLDSIRNAGVGLLRQKFDWDFLTFGNGANNINWSYLDRFMTATAQAGISVMPVLFDPPPSMTTAPAAGAQRGNYPPRDLGAIGDFGAMLAAHYGTNGSFWAENPQLPRHPITAWQIWNEPTLPVYWEPAPNAAAYVQMLRLASQKIKAVDPNAEIVTAGLPDSHIKGAVSLLSYIKQLYRAGAAGSFDTLAVNGYAPTSGAVLKLITHIRKVVNRYGGRATALRVSEFGWADRGPERPRGRFTVGKKQGPYTYQAIRSLWKARKRLHLRGIVYYDWRDQPVYAGGKNFWGLHTGLLTRNGQAKPALRWFMKAVASLRRLR